MVFFCILYIKGSIINGIIFYLLIVIFCNSLFLRKGPNTCPFVSSVNIFFRNYQDCKVEIDMSGFFHACLKTALSGMG